MLDGHSVFYCKIVLFLKPHHVVKVSQLIPKKNHFVLGSKHQVVAYTEKSQIKHENRHIQLVREYGFHPRTKASVEDGGLLPRKYEPFPQNMYGKPLEEIDSFIYEEVSSFLLLVVCL